MDKSNILKKEGRDIRTCPMSSGKYKKEKIDYKTYVDDQELTIQNIWANLC